MRSAVYSPTSAPMCRKIEPPLRKSCPHRLPTLDGVSIPFALRNANKRKRRAEPRRDPQDQARFSSLWSRAPTSSSTADVQTVGGFRHDMRTVGDSHGHLVTMWSPISEPLGPARGMAGDGSGHVRHVDRVVAIRADGGGPGSAPDGIASATAARQAAWAVLVAYFNRLRCGVGDYIDFSPIRRGGFWRWILRSGTQGQAASVRQNAEVAWAPKNQDAYRSFDARTATCASASYPRGNGMGCATGSGARGVGIPVFDTIGGRTAGHSRIESVLMAALFADKTMDRLVAEGQAHGVADRRRGDSNRSIGFGTPPRGRRVGRYRVRAGVRARVPVGYWVVDGVHAGLSRPRSVAGECEPFWASASSRPNQPTG